MSRLKEAYKSKIKGELKSKFEYPNPMMIPKLVKIVINMGCAEAAKDKNVLADCVKEMALLSGQHPIVCKARKSISNFKLREGTPIGVKVTLRAEKMWDFLERLLHWYMPRIRDFRGFNAKGDSRGAYTLGITDQQIFAELPLDEVKRVQGMNITFVTTAKNDEETIELLRLLGIPFKGMTVVVN